MPDEPTQPTPTSGAPTQRQLGVRPPVTPHPGGIVGAVSSLMTGETPEDQAERRARQVRAARRGEYIGRLHAIQQTAITVAILFVCLAAMTILPALYWLVLTGRAWQ